MRSDYRIKPIIKLEVDKKDYLFAFLPTIIWMPWKLRYPDTSVIEIWWLIFHVAIGIWERKQRREKDV